MSGAAGLSAAKRRRAEQTPLQQSKPQQSPQVQTTVAKSTNPAPRIMTPMLILEDHELRLRYIEKCLKEGVHHNTDNSDKLENKDNSMRKDVVEVMSSTTNDEFKQKLATILNRIDELESNNNNLLKKVDFLKSELSDMTNKHSSLQSFAMETNISLLKHKDTFEPAVFNRLMNFLLDKTSVGSSGEPDTATRDAVLSGNYVKSETTTIKTENVVLEDDKTLSISVVEKKMDGLTECVSKGKSELLSIVDKIEPLQLVKSEPFREVESYNQVDKSATWASVMGINAGEESVAVEGITDTTIVGANLSEKLLESANGISESVNETVTAVKTGNKKKYKLNV